MLTRFFNSQTKTITFAAILLSVSALVSRILGLARDRLLAWRFGAGADVDIYVAAFRIPDFIYGILIMGGVAAVFLPVFAEYFKKNQTDAWKLTNNVLNCFLVLLIFICGILAIFTPQLIKFITPGFTLEKQALTVSLTRIMFLSPILFGLSSIFSGILHYFNRFLAYSVAPVLYNLGIIYGILFFIPVFGLKGLAYGVILGAALHWIIQIPAARGSGFRYRPSFNFKHSGLIKIFKLIIPRTIGAAAYHINLIVITAIASTLATGSIAIFYYSNNLQYIPIGIIGVSFALASFPALSRAWAAGKKEEFWENFSLTFRQILFFVIPISFLMFILRAQIVRLVLGTDKFLWSDTRLVAASLGIFCLSIFAFSLIPFLARVFFSFQDTKTPVIIGIVSMIANITLSYLFVFLLKSENSFQIFMINFLKLQNIKNIEIIGLPLALSISGIFQVSLLLGGLTKKIGQFPLSKIYLSLKKITLGSILMGIATYFSLRVLAGFVNMQTFLGIFLQATIAFLFGVFVYILVSFCLKSPELETIKSSILKQFRKS